MTEIDWYQNMEATLPTLRTKDIYHTYWEVIKQIMARQKLKEPSKIGGPKNGTVCNRL